MKNTHFVAPPFLKKGDKVAIVALASRVTYDEIKSGITLLQSWGLEVIIGQTIGAVYDGFAGNDTLRAADFQQYLADKSIKAIFSARGGYGCSRIIDSIDYRFFQNNPKWIIGFSDITALHGKIQNLGFQSIHGPMPKTMRNDFFSDETLHQVLFGKNIDYQITTNALNRNGEAKSEIIGGNLCLLAHCIGSESELNYHEKILFLEDVGEYLYNIDRMMVQLKRVGKFEKLAGLVVGQFSDSKENSQPFGKTAYEIIAEHTANYSYPIAFDFPIGHTDKNWAVRCGEKVVLEVTEKNVRLYSDTEELASTS